MNAYFADTFYFFALVNSRDPAHAQAVALTKALTRRLVTTSWILTELADGWASPAYRRDWFLQLDRQLRARPDVDIVLYDESLLREGTELYGQRLDKEWSLTDCISFVVMKRENLQEALTGDHHFEQAGFIALLK